jgi:hypothetical protein
MTSAVERVQRTLRRYGLGGAVGRVWAVARARVVLSEEHVWYCLEPNAPRPKPRLPDGLRVKVAERAEVARLDQWETLSTASAETRISEGNDLWVVLEGAQIIFSCWIFNRATPVVGAPDGLLTLDPGMVCLEDSFTGAAARGRGVAPSAWAAIADTLAAEGVDRIITKVGVENVASRRAVEKAGFEPVAVMRFRRRFGVSRTSIRTLDEGRGRFFARRLDSV